MRKHGYTSFLLIHVKQKGDSLFSLPLLLAFGFWHFFFIFPFLSELAIYRSFFESFESRDFERRLISSLVKRNKELQQSYFHSLSELTYAEHHLLHVRNTLHSF